MSQKVPHTTSNNTLLSGILELGATPPTGKPGLLRWWLLFTGLQGSKGSCKGSTTEWNSFGQIWVWQQRQLYNLEQERQLWCASSTRLPRGWAGNKLLGNTKQWSGWPVLYVEWLQWSCPVDRTLGVQTRPLQCRSCVQQCRLPAVLSHILLPP